VPLSYLYDGSHDNSREQLAVQKSLIDRQRDALMTQIHAELDGQDAELLRLQRTLELDDKLLQLREQVSKQTEIQLSLGTSTMTELIGDLSQEDAARARRSVHLAKRELACKTFSFIKGEL
jgi:hypothetical protein